MFRPKQSRLITLSLLVFLVTATGVVADPVVDFIIKSDSIARDDPEAFDAYVEDNTLLVGAAVAYLLDVAFDAGTDGNPAGEKENVDFAAKLAETYTTQTGSRAVMALVTTHRGWTGAQRETRVRADALRKEAEAIAREDPAKASTLYEQALPLYEEINDRHSVAIVWGGMGVAHWYQGDLETVKDDYAKALEARRAVEDHILEGRTLNGLGSANLQLGDYATAADYYRQAIQLRRATGDMSGLGTSITYLGHCYYNTNRLVDARDKYEEALVILEEQGSQSQMVDVLNGIANCYAAMGRIERANETYLRAAQIARAAGETRKEVRCRINLAENYGNAARYAEAFAQLEGIEELLEADDQIELRIRFLNARGGVYILVGDVNRARDDFLESAKLAKQLGRPGLEIDALTNVCNLYRNLGFPDRGLETANRAKEIAIENADGRRYRDALTLIGNLELQKGNHQAALENWREALEQDEYDQVSTLVLEDKLHIASILTESGKPREARELAYAIAPEVRESGGAALVVFLDLALGDSYEDENPDSAAAHYEAALSVVEGSRESLGGDELRSEFLSGDYRKYFEEVARYYAGLDAGSNGAWSKRAFVTVERARARGFLDLLVASELARTNDEEEEILETLYSLDPEAKGYEKRRAQLQEKFERARRERVEESIGSASEGANAGIDDMRAALPKKTVALAYALGDTASLLWVIDRDGHDMVTLPPRSKLEPEVDRIRDALRRPGGGDAVLRATSRRLYLDLVAPAAKRMAHAEHLVIMPDGFLNEVPFDVLLTTDPSEDASWQDQPYLTRKWSTLYVPSATIYLNLRERRKPKYKLDLVAYGDPDYALFTSGVGAEFQQLPYAREEVDEISRNVKPKKRDVRVGADANEARLKKQLRAGSPRVLHLAAHGIANPIEPSMSGVVLCPDPEGIDDGYLRTLEILSLSARNGLVVVSACESALGRVSRGEGVVGLSRAFIASGSGSVVASLWSVSDESTSRLMAKFYDEMLGHKKPAAVALQKARLELIGDDRYAHPFFWSPFIVIGTDTAPW